MTLRFPKFTDPLYASDDVVEFDSAQVQLVVQKQVPLTLRGKFWATSVTLRNGDEFLISGKVADQIEAARRGM